MLFLLLALSVSAQTQTHQNQTHQNQSLLWEISGKNLKTPSYLFGTFHIMCRDQFKISESMLEKLKSTKFFCGELDLDDPTLQSQMMQLMQMPDKTIASYLPD